MEAEETPSGVCQLDGCVAFRFDTDAALAEGWFMVQDRLYCPDHGGFMAWKASREAVKAENAAKLHEKLHETWGERARTSMTSREYTYWFVFQQDLVTYRREHGFPAPKQLTGLGPRDWLKIHRSGRTIDVESEVLAIQEREKAAQATREWIARRV